METTYVGSNRSSEIRAKPLATMQRAGFGFGLRLPGALRQSLAVKGLLAGRPSRRGCDLGRWA